MTFPYRVKTFVTAIEEAKELSKDKVIYVYQVLEGGYILDTLQREYSNERLIRTYFKGQIKWPVNYEQFTSTAKRLNISVVNTNSWQRTQ